jgi:hypothetical protein
MRGRRCRAVVVAAVLALALGACGGDDGGGDGGGGEAATTAPRRGPLPDECPDEVPFQLAIAGGEALPGIDGPAFEVTTAQAVPFPIVPDPEGELGEEEAAQQAAETNLLGYTLYLTDFPFTEDDLDAFGLRPTPPDGTLVALTVVPPTLEPLAAGDTVTGGRPEYETAATLGTVSTYYATATVEQAPFLSTSADAPGRVEVLHVDDDWLCVRWTEAGQVSSDDGGGTYEVDQVVAGRLLARVTTPTR